MVRYNPKNFGTFDNLLDRFFHNEFELNHLSKSFRPQVDISETEKAFEIEVSVPGINKEDFKIDFNEGKLTISGERKQTEEKDTKNYHTRETKYGSFARSFQLPDSVDEAKIKASYENGILSLVIPKDEKKSLSRTIKVS
ncbi:MAG: Hsp20/alpha crystallin family protein [Cyclobacteriaceae bacterium]